MQIPCQFLEAVHLVVNGLHLSVLTLGRFSGVEEVPDFVVLLFHKTQRDGLVDPTPLTSQEVASLADRPFKAAMANKKPAS
jgi:hypothetical protein